MSLEDSPQATFSDNQGRDWRLEFTIGICRRLKAELGFDIGDLQGGEALMAIALNPVKFGTLLWLLCERQADAQKVTEEDFGESIGGDALEDAFTALTGAVINFTRPQMRGAVAKVIETAEKAVETSGEAVAEAIEKNAAQLQQTIRTETEKVVAKAASGN